MAKRLLITGFDPFGGDSVNPSWECVSKLPDSVGEYALCKLQIPTVFGKAAEAVLTRAEDVILCVGLAGGRDAVTPERIAVNIRDARIPDNRGNQPRDAFVIPGAPAAYFATVPVADMVKAIRNAGIPAAVSNTAGTFVCNDVLYALLHRFAGTGTRVGFVHVPYIPAQGSPCLPQEQLTQALTAAIEVL